MDKIQIKKSKDMAGLLIKAPLQLARFIKDMPYSRYNHRTNLWRAPLDRQNSKYVLDLIDKGVPIKTYDNLIDVFKKYLIVKKLVKIPFPREHEFKLTPYTYQFEALDYIHSLDNSALFLDMGLGKTTIALAQMVNKALKNEVDTIVILAPCSITFNWEKEISKHVAQKHSILKLDTRRLGPAKKYSAMLDTYYRVKNKDEPKFLICNIECLSRDGRTLDFLKKYIKGHSKVGIILDEAHFIKNSSAKRTKNIIKLANHKSVVSKIALTGTPISQSIMDVFSIFAFLDKDVIGLPNAFCFKHKYCILGGYQNKQIIGIKDINPLMEKLNPYIYQKTKDEVFDFPDKIHITHYVDITSEQKRANSFLVAKDKEDVKNIPEKDKVMNILTKLIAYQQITSGFRSFYTGSEEDTERVIERIIPIAKNPKIKELLSIIEGLNNKEQIIIWCKYKEEILMVSEALEGYLTEDFDNSSCLFYGGVAPEERNKNKEDFIEGKTRYFIATQQTGGTGLTLINSRYVVYFSNMFSMLNRLQSEDRNHRLGQNNNVTYIDIEAKDTIDTHIKESLAQKKDFQDYVIGLMDNGDDIFDKI